MDLHLFLQLVGDTRRLELFFHKHFERDHHLGVLLAREVDLTKFSLAELSPDFEILEAPRFLCLLLLLLLLKFVLVLRLLLLLCCIRMMRS